VVKVSNVKGRREGEGEEVRDLCSALHVYTFHEFILLIGRWMQTADLIG